MVPYAHRGRLRHWSALLGSYAFILVVGIFVLFPFYWMINSSLKSTGEIFSIPPTWFPAHPTLGAYNDLANDPLFPRYFLNSVVVASGTTLLALVVGSLAAFALARFRFRGSATLSTGLLLTQLLPQTALLVPLFLIWTRLHLYDTPIALILTYLTFAVPVATWLLTSFFDSIPVEIEQQALIDGCTRLQSFWHVLLPLSRGGLGGTAIYVFLAAWSEFVFALTFLSSDDQRTLPVGLSLYIGQHSTAWGDLMAGATIATIPVLVLFLFIQRFFVAGLTAGAVK
jgi:multiple sugar transport system permease protein/raffinose/stachyose/melibiose transport system permease protein